MEEQKPHFAGLDRKRRRSMELIRRRQRGDREATRSPGQCLGTAAARRSGIRVALWACGSWMGMKPFDKSLSPVAAGGEE